MQSIARTCVLRRTIRILTLFALAAATLANPAAGHAATGPNCYVKWNAAGTPDGNSWLSAFTDLNNALTDPNCTTIWIAEGAYFPTTPADHSFTIASGKKLYGGFAGGETDLAQRNLVDHPTVLSGDIDHNDTNHLTTNIDDNSEMIVGSNSPHIVTMVGSTTAITNTTILDSLIITGGDALPGPSTLGGGLLCFATGSGKSCSPKLNLVIFKGNRAAYGGAIYIDANTGATSSPAISYAYLAGNHAMYGGAVGVQSASSATASPSFYWVTFANNSAGTDGGAVYVAASAGGVANPTFAVVNFDANVAGMDGGGAIIRATDSGSSSAATFGFVSFTDNQGQDGGGLLNAGLTGGISNPIIVNTTFHGNIASDRGGGFYNTASAGTATPTLRNVTLNGNQASGGGGMEFSSYTGTTFPWLVNVIAWGDTASSSGQEIKNYGGALPDIDHSVIQGSGGSGAGWDAALGNDLGGNLDADPKLQAIAYNGGPIPSMALLTGSSAIDAGADGDCAVYDARAVSRPRGPHCDIGAYERIPPEHTDFDGDYSNGIAYFHEADGLWGILHSGDNFSYGAAQFLTWGQSGDIVVPGDFDGDGMSDPTIRRPPAGVQSAAYMVLKSSTGYDYGSPLTIPAGWPGLGDTPVVGDFNGDRIDEPAIWRGNSGVWIVPASPGFTTYGFRAWGATGDKPVAADMDGDGISDIGYWRPSTGQWGFLHSGDGFSYAAPQYFSWGASTDTPVIADFDGDGLADIAVVTPPAGGQSAAYRILLSTKSYSYSASLTVPAGWPGLHDTPVPNDYDGDGKADPAIWRGNTGVWIIPMSSTNYTTYMFAAWGASGDQVIK